MGASKLNLLACHDCDLLLRGSQCRPNHNIFCPRCGALLYRAKSDSMQKTLALSITGLLLFIPAYTLPLLTMEMLGQSNTSTMLNGIFQMIDGGYWWMSALVFFCSILAPVLKLFLLFCVSLGNLLGLVNRFYVSCLKLYQQLEEWGMFDVYMLGVLVSAIKMKDYGTLTPGMGLASFVILLVTASAASAVFDAKLAWQHAGDDVDQALEASLADGQ